MSLKDLIAYGAAKKKDVSGLATPTDVSDALAAYGAALPSDVAAALVAYGAAKPADVTASVLDGLAYVPETASPHWYINSAVTTSGDGKSPATPFKTIQEGVDAAADGDVIMVAPGAYNQAAHADGLRVNHSVILIGVQNQTMLYNDNVGQESIIHVIGDTGDTDLSVKIDGFLCIDTSGSSTINLIQLDRDAYMSEICNCTLIPGMGWGIHISVNRTDARFLTIHDCTFAGFAIEAISTPGTLTDDIFLLLFIKRNVFLLCDPAININGDTTTGHNIFGCYIQDNDFNLDMGSNGFIDLGEYTGFNTIVQNRFGIAAALITVKDARANSSIFSNVLLDNVGTYDVPSVSPYCVAPITCHDGYTTTPYTFGAFNAVIGAYTFPTSHIRVKGLTVNPDVVDLDWVIEIYWGPTGEELTLSRWEGILSGAMSLPELGSDFSIPSGNPVWVKVACDNQDSTSHRIDVRLLFEVMQ